MVRVWHVNPKFLDDKRLLGEHHEIHVLLGAIVKLHKGRKGGWVSHPQTRKYRNNVLYLEKRHELVVKEMKKRGWKHKTPLNLKQIPKPALKNYRPTKAEIRKDISDLKKRWKREGKTKWLKKIADYG